MQVATKVGIGLPEDSKENGLGAIRRQPTKIKQMPGRQRGKEQAP